MVPNESMTALVKARSNPNLRVLARPGLATRKGNPYTWLLYSHMACQIDDFSLRQAFLGGHYNILHLHWPEADLNAYPSAIEAYLKLQRRFWAIDYMRARGTKLFWTVHNLSAHERRHARLERWFWRELLVRLDGYFTLSEGGKTEATNRFSSLQNVPGFVVPHGHYRDEYPAMPGTDSRAVLGVPKNSKVLLFFGEIRPYKNLPLLIDVFRRYRDQDSILLIVGQARDSALANNLRAQANGDSRIRFENSFVPAERAHLYFNSADLVLLPYRDILNSGTALLSLSFNRPILVPNRGAMGELSTRFGAEWVRTFDELTTAQLSEAINWALTYPRPAVAPLEDLNWGSLAQLTIDAYQRVISPCSRC